MTGPLTLPRQRLHPLTPLVRGAKLVALAAVAVSWRGLSDLGLLHWLIAMTVILIGAVLVSAVVWAVTGYEVVGRELRVHEGLLSRRVRTIPLERVQAIDVVRPALARLFGLAELRLEVIGGGKTEAPLAYLTIATATELRANLLGLATGAAPTTPDDERPLFAVDNNRLLAAQLLTPQALSVPVGAAFVIWPALSHPDWTLIGAASTITAFLGVFQVPVRRVLDEWDFRIADDGTALRVRQGLLNKRSQSVPPRRVQGIKLTWPLLWRPAGWARARMDVAGYGGDGEEQLRAGTLVPVAATRDAVVVASAVLGAAVIGTVDVTALRMTGPPRRARWLAPLAWSRIGVAVTDDFVAVREGVLTRELVAVPLARAQSVRVVQGPLQRLLSLATVTVDTAGGLTATARLRDAAEAHRLADDLAVRSRTARHTFSARSAATRPRPPLPAPEVSPPIAHAAAPPSAALAAPEVPSPPSAAPPAPEVAGPPPAAPPAPEVAGPPPAAPPAPGAANGSLAEPSPADATAPSRAALPTPAGPAAPSPDDPPPPPEPGTKT